MTFVLAIAVMGLRAYRSVIRQVVQACVARGKPDKRASFSFVAILVRLKNYSNKGGGIPTIGVYPSLAPKLVELCIGLTR